MRETPKLHFVEKGKVLYKWETGEGVAVPRRFPPMGVERAKCCENIEWLAKELGVPRQTLYRWHEESERAEVELNQPTEKSRESRLRREVGRFEAFAARKDIGDGFFSKAPCRESRFNAARSAALENRHLRLHPGRSATARRFVYRADVCASGSQPGGILSAPPPTRPVG